MTDRVQSRIKGWTPKQAVMLSFVCLTVGIAWGWSIRSAHSRASAASEKTAIATSPAATEAMPAAPASTAAAAMASPSQLKEMADTHAKPLLDQLQSNPKNPDLLASIGNVYYDAQQYPAAIQKLERVITIDPHYMKAYDNLGLCYEAAGRLDDAVATYQRAVDLNRQGKPVSPWPPLNLGTLLVKLEQLDDAEKYLRDSLLADPKFAQAHYVFGMLLEKRGRDEEAIRELELAAALDTTYAQPHYALGRIYRRAGNPAKAGAELDQFEKLKQAKSEKRP